MTKFIPKKLNLVLLRWLRFVQDVRLIVIRAGQVRPFP